MKEHVPRFFKSKEHSTCEMMKYDLKLEYGRREYESCRMRWKSSQRPSVLGPVGQIIDLGLLSFLFFLVMTTLGFISLTFIYNISYVYHILHYVPSIYLFYNWKFVPSECLHPIHLSPPVNTNLIAFFYESVCSFLKCK